MEFSVRPEVVDGRVVLEYDAIDGDVDEYKVMQVTPITPSHKAAEGNTDQVLRLLASSDSINLTHAAAKVGMPHCQMDDLRAIYKFLKIEGRRPARKRDLILKIWKHYDPDVTDE